MNKAAAKERPEGRSFAACFSWEFMLYLKHQSCGGGNMENAERAKKKIRSAFIEMAKEMPIEQIQVKSLAQRAGISRSSFYIHYESVWDVLQEIEDDLFSTTYEIKKDYLNGIPARDPMEISHDVLKHLFSSSDLIAALTGHDGEQAYLAAWTKQIKAQISMWRGMDLRQDTASARLLAEFTIGGIQRMIREWSTRQEDISAEELRDLFDRIHIHLQALFKELD